MNDKNKKKTAEQIATEAEPRQAAPLALTTPDGAIVSTDGRIEIDDKDFSEVSLTRKWWQNEKGQKPIYLLPFRRSDNVRHLFQSKLEGSKDKPLHCWASHLVRDVKAEDRCLFADGKACDGVAGRGVESVVFSFENARLAPLFAEAAARGFVIRIASVQKDMVMHRRLGIETPRWRYDVGMVTTRRFSLPAPAALLLPQALENIAATGRADDEEDDLPFGKEE